MAADTGPRRLWSDFHHRFFIDVVGRMLTSLHEPDASPPFARPDNAVQEEFIQEFPSEINE